MSSIQEILLTENILNVSLFQDFILYETLCVLLHVVDAAKKHHGYLAWLEKEESLEAKAARLKSSRVKQQRIRVSKSCMSLEKLLHAISSFQLYERRCMQAWGKEVSVMQQISEKVMTDEETDCDDGDSQVLVRRMPPWRSSKLTKLMRTLDSHKNAKSEAVPKKECRIRPFSERSPLNGLPKWVLQTSATTHENSSSPTDSSSTPASTQIHSPMSSPEPSPQCSAVFTLPSQSSTPTQAQT